MKVCSPYSKLWLYKGYIWGCIGIMGKNMETKGLKGLGFRVPGLRFGVSGLG